MGIRGILIVVTAAVASLLEIIDTSIVNVAIPTMMGNIGATLDDISWVSTGYMIANSIILPISGWLGMRFGRKNYFTLAIIAFTTASFMCGAAPNLGFLVMCRIVQGLAGGALLPTSQTLIQEQFPQEKAGLAMAIFGMSIMVGPALGPTVGGYLTDNFGWRSIFYVNVPLGLIAGLLSWRNVTDQEGSGREAEMAKKAGVDWTGLFLLCITIGCFQYILERGQEDQWFESKTIRTCAGLSLSGFIAFIYWELHTAHPILDLRLFKTNVVRWGSFLMLVLGILIYALTFVIPIFVSTIIPAMSATQTGLLFIPGSVATAALMVPAGLLLKWFPPKTLVVVGLVLSETLLLIMARLTSISGSDDVLVPMLIRGMAMPFLFVPINQMVLGSVDRSILANVASLQNFFRQVGGSIGISLLSTLLSRYGAQNYLELMSTVNALNSATLLSGGAGASHMASQLGMATPALLSAKSLHGRALLQSFSLSFEQLCATIMVIVACGVIPVIFIKPKKHTGPPVMNAH
jgi:DHA2 family multidrug resistance protein